MAGYQDTRSISAPKQQLQSNVDQFHKGPPPRGVTKWLRDASVVFAGVFAALVLQEIVGLLIVRPQLSSASYTPQLEELNLERGQLDDIQRAMSAAKAEAVRTRDKMMAKSASFKHSLDSLPRNGTPLPYIPPPQPHNR